MSRRTRASSRVRNSQIQSLVKDLVGDDVNKFHADDVDNSTKEDINGDPDFEVKEERPKEWKGKGKNSEKIGGGRGRLRKDAKVEDHPSIKRTSI